MHCIEVLGKSSFLAAVADNEGECCCHGVNAAAMLSLLWVLIAFCVLRWIRKYG